jgi:hypothetical protein
MSFKRLDPEDFLLSTDAIAAPAFAGGSNTNTGGNAANSGISADYYKAYKGDDGRVEVTLAHGEKAGSVTGSQAVYRQFANIIQGNADTDLPVGDEFLAIALDRQRFTWRCGAIEGITPGQGGAVLTGSSDVTFTDAGRQFNNTAGDLYLYPDIGVALIAGDPGALAGSIGANIITADSEEVLTSNYVFIRARNAEFNYSQNPTFIDSTTGGVRYTDFITAPQTFITTVGLYNDNGDCLAVAKLSKPLKKDFTKEALIRVKLDF